jgi:hypothetical protein
MTAAAIATMATVEAATSTRRFYPGWGGTHAPGGTVIQQKRERTHRIRFCATKPDGSEGNEGTARVLKIAAMSHAP